MSLNSDANLAKSGSSSLVKLMRWPAINEKHPVLVPGNSGYILKCGLLNAQFSQEKHLHEKHSLWPVLSPLLPFYVYTTIVMVMQSVHFGNKRVVRMKASQHIRCISRLLLRHFDLTITVSLCATLVSQTPYGNVMCAGIQGMILIRWWSIDICPPHQVVRKIDVKVWIYNLTYIKSFLILLGYSVVSQPSSEILFSGFQREKCTEGGINSVYSNACRILHYLNLW